MENNKEQFSFWFEGKNCEGFFDTIDDAIEGALTYYDKNIEIEDLSDIFYVNKVDYFDLKYAVEDIVRNLPDTIYEGYISDWCGFGFDFDGEAECNVMKKEEEKFVKETTEALYPILEKYLIIEPHFISYPDYRFNIKTRIKEKYPLHNFEPEKF